MVKKKPVSLAPSQWDHGATGPANRKGLIFEERGHIDPETGEMVNPNGITGVRRVDMLEIYAGRGWISLSGFNAGCRLRDAWDRIHQGPGWPDNDRVQSSPKPDHAVEIQIGRMSAFIWISQRVPKEHAGIIEHVAIRGGAIGGVIINGRKPYLGKGHAKGKADLHLAFNLLADAIGG
jgi:hypothetical protein